MGKNLWRRTVALGLSSILLLSGCGGGDKGEGTAKSTPTPEPTPTPVAESEGPTDWSKYNAYLKMVNSLYDIEEVLTVYFDNVDYAEDFTVTGDYGAIKDTVQFYTSFTYSVKDALDYADESPAYPEADAAVLALGESPIQVMDALEDLASYMRWDEYQEDGLAKAPEIHAQLWQALQTYDQYYGAFMAAINDLADQTRDEDLENMKENGEMILYHSMSMIYACQDILDNIWAQAQAGDPSSADLPPIDLTDLSPLFADLQTSYDGLIAALDSQEEREKVSSFTGVVGDSSVKLYTNHVNNCFGKMGSLAQVLLDGGDYGEAYNTASEAVNGFVSAYNNVN